MMIPPIEPTFSELVSDLESLSGDVNLLGSISVLIVEPVYQGLQVLSIIWLNEFNQVNRINRD